MGSMVLELLIIVLTKAKRDRFMQPSVHLDTVGLEALSRCSCTMRGGRGGGVTSGASGVKSLRLGGKVFWGNMTMGLLHKHF